jgi:excisionase family DNA binding protein
MADDNELVIPYKADQAANSAYLTKAQAAQLLGCTTRYIERAAASGRLKILKPTGKFWRVRRSDLDSFLESGASVGQQSFRKEP